MRSGVPAEWMDCDVEYGVVDVSGSGGASGGGISGRCGREICCCDGSAVDGGGLLERRGGAGGVCAQSVLCCVVGSSSGNEGARRPGLAASPALMAPDRGEDERTRRETTSTRDRGDGVRRLRAKSCASVYVVFTCAMEVLSHTASRSN